MVVLAGGRCRPMHLSQGTPYERLSNAPSDASPRALSRLPPLLFFFITLQPRVERYTQSMSLKYEPASEPLHNSVKQLFLN